MPRSACRKTRPKLRASREQGSARRDAPIQLTAKGKVVGFWNKDPKGNLSVQIKAGSLPAAKEKRLREFLEKLFD